MLKLLYEITGGKEDVVHENIKECESIRAPDRMEIRHRIIGREENVIDEDIAEGEDET